MIVIVIALTVLVGGTVYFVALPGKSVLRHEPPADLKETASAEKEKPEADAFSQKPEMPAKQFNFKYFSLPQQDKASKKITERYGDRTPFYDKDGSLIEYYWPSDPIAPGLSGKETEMLLYNEGTVPFEIMRVSFLFINDGIAASIYSGTWEKFLSRQSWNRVEYMDIGAKEYTKAGLILNPGEKGKLHYHLTYANAFLAKNQSAHVVLTIKRSGAVETINQTLVRKDAPATFSADTADHSLNQFSSTLAKDLNMPSCGDKMAFFTVSPITSKDFYGIVPIGTLSPTGHTFPSPHLYFHVRRSDPKNFDSVPVEVPAVSPGNIRVTKISLIEAINRPDFTDSYVEFSVCKEIRGYFDHVKKLSSKLQNAYDSAKAIACNEYSQSYQALGTIQMKKCDKLVSVDLNAGETLGIAGGSKGQMVFDFGAIDYRNKPHVFANSSRWYYRPEILYITCALDYFSSPLKESLKNRLGQSDMSVKRTIEPICGTVAQDKPGTAQGIWVVKGTGAIGHEGSHLSLAHDNVDPKVGVFSVGTSMEKGGLKFGKYTFTPQHSGFVDREFSEVTASNEVFCYELYDDWYPRRRIKDTVLLIQLTSPTKLRMEKQTASFCGLGPRSFGESYIEFER